MYAAALASAMMSKNKLRLRYVLPSSGLSQFINALFSLRRKLSNYRHKLRNTMLSLVDSVSWKSCAERQTEVAQRTRIITSACSFLEQTADRLKYLHRVSSPSPPHHRAVFCLVPHILPHWTRPRMKKPKVLQTTSDACISSKWARPVLFSVTW